MNREIPGYYYDSAKRKYFRIEDSRTAPAQAAWSSENVKRRAVEQKEEARKRERLRRAKGRVKRAPVRDVPMLGGLLAREAGEVGRGAAARPAGEEVVRAWTGALREKGSVNHWPEALEGECTVHSLWVGGNDERGLGIMWMAGDGGCMAVSHVPRDADDRINFGYAAERNPDVDFRPRDMLFEATDIKFHAQSGNVLVSWPAPQSEDFAIAQYATTMGNMENPLRLANTRYSFDHLPMPTCGPSFTARPIRKIAPAPSGSRLTCIAGTDQGILQLEGEELTSLTPPPPTRWRPSKRRGLVTPDADRAPWQGDILAVDFAHHSSSEVILAGTRSSRVCVLDLRVPPREWTPRSNTLRHPSSVAHVRSVGPYEVLAAGPRNAMALYDIRFLQQQQPSQLDEGWSVVGQWRCNRTRPVVTFPAYRNAAHIDTGLDVLLEPGYGSRGIVAAAHDDETVGLYSLRDGSRLPGGAVDSIKAGAVVRSMMWATLPGDRHPSLFVGQGSCVKKYSFWA